MDKLISISEAGRMLGITPKTLQVWCVEFILVEYPDRLARFGYTYLEEHAKSFNVTVESIEQNQRLESNEEMVNDLISIVTCFSAKLLRIPSWK